MRVRDMTDAQFRTAIRKRGWRLVGFAGYVDVGDGTSISYLNAPDQTRRARLAYLLAEAEKVKVRAARGA